MRERVRFDKRILIPIIHFLSTFGLERLVLKFDSDSALQVAFSVPLSDTFSLPFERVMCYVISKLFAGIIIFAIWKLIFRVFDSLRCKDVKPAKSADRRRMIIFTAIWAVLMVCILIWWPDNLRAGLDNDITFSFSLRLMPEYWHSMLLGCLYTAAMMIFPHSIAIVLLQGTLFVFTVGYLYARLENSPVLGKYKKLKYFALLIILFRDAFNILNNPERPEINASLLLFFITLVTMDIIDKKVRSDAQLIMILCFGAFLSVFRSESIIPVLLGSMALLIINYRMKPIKRFIFIMVYALVMIAFIFPGKVGEKKYYGQDYKIINTFPSLRNILNSQDSNLSYEGAAEDIEAIDSIVPTELIGEYGTWSYRRYNYGNGHIDFNQSRAGIDKSSRYMSAYKNIVLHNIPMYLKTQGCMLLSALETGVDELEIPYTGEHHEITEIGRELWEAGTEDYLNAKGRYFWEGFGLRNALYAFLTGIRIGYFLKVTEFKVYAVFNILEILAGIFTVIFSFIKLLKKKKIYLASFISSLILTVYFAALSLVMPVGANMYFHAYFVSMYSVIIIFAGSILAEKDGNGKG